MTREKIVEYIIGYKPEMYKFDDVTFEVLKGDTSVRANYLGMERDFYVEFGEWFPTEWKDDEECDSYEPFTTREINTFFNSFSQLNICTDCDGAGWYEVYQECTRPASECCGGCVEKVECYCSDESKLFPL